MNLMRCGVIRIRYQILVQHRMDFNVIKEQ